MDPDIDGRDVDRAEIAALASEVDADSVDGLVERLDSDDPDERAGAAWRLVEAAAARPTKVRTHLDRVLDCADDEDVWVRRGATWVLAELADGEPDAVASRFSALLELTRADDPLVRQNAVVAVADVTKAYPGRATAGLSTIAPLTESRDPLVRRYAKEAVREVVEVVADRAEDAGYPVVVRAKPAFAGLFPDGVEVVTVNEADQDAHPVYVSFGRDAPERETGDDGERPTGPPAGVPDPPSVQLAADDLAPEGELRETVLTTDLRADVAETTLEHGVATLRRLAVEDRAVRDAFDDAVRQWAAVDDHDHVETVLGHGDGWLATRYDDGDTLDRRGAPATVAEAVWTVECVTKAVSYAHARGVVHGGLHPGAVRYVDTEAGAWDAPVVADWGFAHAASGVETPPLPSGFAAPEHADPETYGRFDQATDVFGLGALAYYLLTGEPPHATADLVPATRLNPGLPDAVEEFFARTLAGEKPTRFETVLAVQTAFDELAADLAGGA